jgi:hypothetical protein
MRKDWNGIMKILEIEQLRNGEVIWSKKNLYNILHSGAEQYFLEALFRNPADGTIPPEYYYLGLDARTSLLTSDTMSSIIDEPSSNGYFRQLVSSKPNQSTGWSIISSDGYSKALCSVVTFSAAGGSWGPVTTLFLTTKNNNTGVLISSASLSDEAYLEDGDSINLRMVMTLRDCPLE